MTILDEILANTAIELEAAKKRRAPALVAAEAEACSRTPAGFREALRAARRDGLDLARLQADGQVRLARGAALKGA